VRVLNLDLPVDDWAKEEGIAEKRSETASWKPQTPPQDGGKAAFSGRRS
jgi:hypothetical protein